MPLTQNQIDQATALCAVVDDNVNPLCLARDRAMAIIDHHDIVDEATGMAWLLRCKDQALASAQAIVDALTP